MKIGSPTPSVSAAAQPGERKLRATAEAFEAQFVKSMLEQALSGLTGEGPLGSAGAGNEAWRSFLIDEHAKSITAKGGFGIAAQVYKAMRTMAQGGRDASL